MGFYEQKCTKRTEGYSYTGMMLTVFNTCLVWVPAKQNGSLTCEFTDINLERLQKYNTE